MNSQTNNRASCQNYGETHRDISGHTSSEAHYRRQADMCRSEALLRRADPSTSAQWLKIAAEYDKLAASAAAMTSRAINVERMSGSLARA